jgi:hypothetical protein
MAAVAQKSCWGVFRHALQAAGLFRSRSNFRGAVRIPITRGEIKLAGAARCSCSLKERLPRSRAMSKT